MKQQRDINTRTVYCNNVPGNDARQDEMNLVVEVCRDTLRLFVIVFHEAWVLSPHVVKLKQFTVLTQLLRCQ